MMKVILKLVLVVCLSIVPAVGQLSGQVKQYIDHHWPITIQDDSQSLQLYLLVMMISLISNLSDIQTQTKTLANVLYTLKLVPKINQSTGVPMFLREQAIKDKLDQLYSNYQDKFVNFRSNPNKFTHQMTPIPDGLIPLFTNDMECKVNVRKLKCNYSAVMDRFAQKVGQYMTVQPLEQQLVPQFLYQRKAELLVTVWQRYDAVRNVVGQTELSAAFDYTISHWKAFFKSLKIIYYLITSHFPVSPIRICPSFFESAPTTTQTLNLTTMYSSTTEPFSRTQVNLFIFLGVIFTVLVLAGIFVGVWLAIKNSKENKTTKSKRPIRGPKVVRKQSNRSLSLISKQVKPLERRMTPIQSVKSSPKGSQRSSNLSLEKSSSVNTILSKSSTASNST